MTSCDPCTLVGKRDTRQLNKRITNCKFGMYYEGNKQEAGSKGNRGRVAHIGSDIQDKLCRMRGSGMVLGERDSKQQK